MFLSWRVIEAFSFWVTDIIHFFMCLVVSPTGN